MKKSILLGLLAALVLTFAGCDLNLFNNFEDIPSFTPQQMNESISEIGEEDDDGDVVITGTLAVTDDPEDSTKPPKVQDAAKTYIDNVTAMVENDTIDDFGDDADKEKIAKNLDTITTAILDKAKVDIETDAAEGLTFEQLMLGENATEEEIAENKEQLDELREVVQKSASASVDIRLAADPKAKSLISDTMIALLNMMNDEDADTSKSARSLDYNGDSYGNLEEYIQFRLVDGTNEYVMYSKHENVNTPNERDFGFDLEENVTDPDKKYSSSLSNGEKGYVLRYDLISDSLGIETDEFLDILNSLVDGDSSKDERVALLEYFLGSGDDDNLALISDIIDLSEVDTLANTFNGIAKSARAFASTLEYTSAVKDEIDTSKISGQLTGGKRDEMATMSMLSLVFDYLFDLGDETVDPRKGILKLGVVEDFLNETDAITSTVENDGTDDYLVVEIKYLAEFIPADRNVVVDSQTKTLRKHFLAELDFDLLLEHMFKWGNIVIEDGSDLTNNMKSDAVRIDKLAALLDMKSLYTDDEVGGITTFRELLLDMIDDDGEEE